VNARVTEALARDPEAARLLEVLDACDWNQARAAVRLGISRRTLVSRLSAYGLTRKRTPTPDPPLDPTLHLDPDPDRDVDPDP
jgi:DNA-binding NtrC family response regulator